MLNDSSGNAASSDATSAAAKAADEAEFLARQALEAQAAIERSVRELKNHVERTWSEATDLRGWVERHPWISLGSAAAVGFVAGSALTPKPNESVQDKWRRTAASLAGNGQADEAREDQPERDAKQSAGAGPSPWLMILTPLISLAQTAAESYIAAMLANNTQRQQPEPNPNGDAAMANGECGMGNGE